MNTAQPPAIHPPGRHFRTDGFDAGSFFFTGLTGLATFLILAILAIILGNVVWEGWGVSPGASSPAGRSATCSAWKMPACSR